MQVTRYIPLLLMAVLLAFLGAGAAVGASPRPVAIAGVIVLGVGGQALWLGAPKLAKYAGERFAAE
jgi:uncharacterized Ntn-hydrolase superfamily protein